MVIALILLGAVAIYLIIKLLILKKSLQKLSKEYERAISNLEGEQHIQIAAPDRALENLAVQMNKGIETYFHAQYSYEQLVENIRNEIMGLSHDLRTPITSIIGYLTFIDTSAFTFEQLEAFEVIERRTNDLNTLIEQLYEYVRVEKNELTLHYEQVDLYQMLKEHLLSFYLEFEKRGIELTLEFPKKEGPIYINADNQALLRVLSNLTSNTLKYCHGQAAVILQVKKEHAVVTYKTPKANLTDYDIAHLFERFYKKDGSRGASQSSGLGLTIAKLLIEQMNGEMEALGDDEFLYLSFKLPLVKGDLSILC